MLNNKTQAGVLQPVLLSNIDSFTPLGVETSVAFMEYIPLKLIMIIS